MLTLPLHCGIWGNWLSLSELNTRVTLHISVPTIDVIRLGHQAGAAAEEWSSGPTNHPSEARQPGKTRPGLTGAGRGQKAGGERKGEREEEIGVGVSEHFDIQRKCKLHANSISL